MFHIFTYGSLMFPAVFERITARRYNRAPAQVKHFRRALLRQHSYPAVLPDRHSPSLEGFVYLNVRESDLRRLDQFEGSYYQRQQVKVLLIEQQQIITAWLYVLKPCYRHLATSREWSPQVFETHHLQRFLSRYCR